MSRRSRGTEITDEMSGWIVAGGLVTMALFPLALPILVLTMIAAIPLVLVALAGALVAAVVAVPVLLVRGLGRRVIGAPRPTRTNHQGGPTLAKEIS
jgi:hypothetical protein